MDIEKNNGKKRRQQSKYSYQGEDEGKLGKGLRKNDRRKARHSSKQFIKEYGKEIEFD